LLILDGIFRSPSEFRLGTGDEPSFALTGDPLDAPPPPLPGALGGCVALPSEFTCEGDGDAVARRDAADGVRLLLLLPLLLGAKFPDVERVTNEDDFECESVGSEGRRLVVKLDNVVMVCDAEGTRENPLLVGRLDENPAAAEAENSTGLDKSIPLDFIAEVKGCEIGN
jgi:hypothetical protein